MGCDLQLRHPQIEPSCMAKSKLYRYPLYLLARSLAFVFSIFPRGMLLSLAGLLGRLAYYLVPRHRESALQHLRSAYGNTKTEADYRLIARRVFENLAKTSVEILLFPKFSSAEVESFTDTGDAYKVYSDLLAEGKGLLGITSHMGNWELLAGIFTLKGYKGRAIARRLRYEPYNKWIESLRRSIGVETVYRGDSPKQILKILKDGYIIGMLPDQDIDSLRGVFVNFFGRPAYTTIAPAKLAIATGSPIIVNFLIRQPGNKYKIVIGDIIRPDAKLPREEAVVLYTRRWMESCEKIIREYPDQWGWMHNRWKTKPSGETGKA